MDSGRRRDFRLLAAGQALSWLGNGLQPVAMAVAVVGTGGGLGGVGAVLTVSVIARLAGSLFGGLWADRVQPRRVMAGSDLVRALGTTGMAVLFASGHHPVAALAALTAVVSGAGAFFAPAMTALKPMLVPAGRLQSANATLSFLQTACTVVGPGLGGVLVAAFGPSVGFGINAASFLASVVTVLLIRAHAPRSARSGVWSELAEGWREVAGRDWLLWGVLAATVYHVANGVLLVLVPYTAIEHLGGADAAGFVAAAEGVGGLLGAAAATRYQPRRMLRAGWLGLMLMPLWPLSYVWPARLSAVLAGAVLGYAGLAFFGVAWETAIQDHVPHRVLARVAAWDTLTSFIGMPLGNALAAPLAARFGTGTVFTGAALVFLCSAAAPLTRTSSRGLARPEPAAAAPTQALA